MLDELSNYATLYNTSNDSTFWQHHATGQVFSLTEQGNNYCLMILDRELGRWDDNGIKTMGQVVHLATNYAN
jgi:hypothetical protein